MSSTPSRFRLSDPVMNEFVAWWKAISSDTATGPARADRATLKRAGDLTAVACTPAYQRIYRRLMLLQEGEPWGGRECDRIAAVIGLAAHVKVSVPMSLPIAMSFRENDSETNPVSALRFARLLDSPDIDSLFLGLRRALPLIDHKVDPRAVANDVFSWGENVKKSWAYAYRWPD